MDRPRSLTWCWRSDHHQSEFVRPHPNSAPQAQVTQPLGALVRGALVNTPNCWATWSWGAEFGVGSGKPRLVAVQIAQFDRSNHQTQRPRHQASHFATDTVTGLGLGGQTPFGGLTGLWSFAPRHCNFWPKWPKNWPIFGSFFNFPVKIEKWP